MKGWQHFKTITHHKWLVLQGCFRVGLYWQGITHDLSKYTPTEFLVGAKYYQGTRSPNEEERAVHGYSVAWMHHKGRNRHHYEYWTDYSLETKQLEPIKMPIRFVAEMFCDRVAASKIYRGKAYVDSHPLEYFLGAKARRRIHPETSDLLEGWLRMLAEEGEDATFTHVRQEVKKGTY
jgi:hypothetical protein